MNYKTIKIITYIGSGLLTCFIVAMLGFAVIGIKSLCHHCPEHQTETKIIHEPLSGWEILTLAIIKTESEFDSTAVGRDSLSWGILQIMPVYVDEVNRILGIERYRHEDAFSVSKSLEMFSIYQEYYNHEHDVMRAIQLHNPTAQGVWYSEKVMRNFRQLVKHEEIRNQL